MRASGTLGAAIVVAAHAAYVAALEPEEGPARPLRYDAPFVRLLPPIFRVVLLTALCLVGFGVDLQVLQYWGMNLWTTHGSVALPTHGTPSPIQTAHASGAAPLYGLALCHVVWATLCWLMYRYHLDPTTGARTWAAEVWEITTMAGIMVLWLVPGPFQSPLRLFNRAMRRLLTPSLRQTIQFSDVILADILTSFAKVLGDVWLSLVVLAYFAAGKAIDDRALIYAETLWAVPVLISVPYLIRLRQCLAEYVTSPRLGGARPMRPLYNALKYASALPVIWLRAWQQYQPQGSHAPHTLVDVLWYVSVLVNSLFSFWWDLTNDWGLDLLQLSTFTSLLHQRGAQLPALHRRRRSHGDTNDESLAELLETRPSHVRRGSMLRAPEKALPFPPSMYWAFIVVNLFLRFTWSLKLSSHWQYLVEWQRGLLLFEALEIVRRSVWVVLRVEWELVRLSPVESY